MRPGRRGGRGDTRRRQPRRAGSSSPVMNDALDSGRGGRAGPPHGQEPRHGHRGARRRGRGDQQLDLPPRARGAGVLLGADRLGHGVPTTTGSAPTSACCATAGEDKELEALLLRAGHLHRLPGRRARCWTKRCRAKRAYYNQRRRWIAAQFYALGIGREGSFREQSSRGIRITATSCCNGACRRGMLLHRAGAPVGRRDDGHAHPWGSIKWWVAVLLLLLAHGDGAARRRRPTPGWDTPLGECPSCSC